MRSTDVYAQAAYDILAALTATAGVRSSQVKFRSADRFIVPNTANGDDSGGVDYSATNPVIGLTFTPRPICTCTPTPGAASRRPPSPSSPTAPAA